MSTTTTNLGLIKPELTDSADITAYNGNWDKIDDKLANADSHAKSKSNPHGVTPDQIGAAPSTHNHSASEINSGTLNSNRLPTVPLTKGGTGATTATQALANLGGAPKTHSHTKSDISDFAHTHSAGEINSGTLSTDRLPTIPVSKGGTGATTAAQALVNLGGASKNHDHTSNGISSLVKRRHVNEGNSPVIAGGSILYPGIHLMTSDNFTELMISLPTKKDATSGIGAFKTGYPALLCVTREESTGKTVVVDVLSGIVGIAEFNEDGSEYTHTIRDANSDYTYGTTDLTPGSSALATGKLHFVYE